MARTDRTTGCHETEEELISSVTRMARQLIPQRDIAKANGISVGTVRRINQERDAPKIETDLNAMFNNLWKIQP